VPQMKRQDRLLWMCWLVYTVSYVGRTGYSANITAIIDRYGIVNATAGLVGTFFFFAYACGQLIHGTFCRYYPKRHFIAAALLISAAVNAVIFTEPEFGIYKYLWLLNGISLSVLWPSLVFTLSLEGNSGDVNRVTFLMSTPTIAGTLVSYCLSALLNQLDIYRWFFLISAILSAATALLWFFSFPFNNGAKDYKPIRRSPETEKKKKKETISAALVMFLVVLGISTAGNSLIKDGLTTWIPKILKDQYSTSDSLSIILTIVLPICGLLGTMLLLWLSKLIKNNMLLCGTMAASMAALLGVIVLLTLPGTDVKSFIPLLACAGIIYCLTAVINTLATAKLPLELSGALDSGLICGVMNFCSYGGSTVSTYSLGKISDAGGWNAVFIFLFSAIGGIALLIFAAFFIQKIKKTGGCD